MKAEREAPAQNLDFRARHACARRPSFGRMRHGADRAGSASVEQAGLAALIALLLLAAIAAVAAGGEVDAGRDLAGAIGKRLACAPAPPRRLPPPPAGPRLRLAAGARWPGRWRRRRSPMPGPAGLPLVPVDFRRCRRESCAVAAGPHLTASGRRTTAFTEIDRPPRSLGWVEIAYWLYRPAIGWERVVRRAGQAQIDAARGVESCSATTPPWSPSRPSPAATTTTSPQANAHPGNGRSRPLPRLVELNADA